MRAAFISDLHLGPAGFHGGIQRKLNQFAEQFAMEFAARTENAGKYDFAIQLGDLIEDDSQETDRSNYRKGLELLQASQIPLYHVVGNHDMAHLTAAELQDLLGLPSLFFSFQAGGCHCIVLHSVLPYLRDGRSIIPPDQVAWLRDDLREAHSPAIVFVHHSLADQDLSGNPWFEGKPEACLIENRHEVRRILADSEKVVAVLNGHLHWNRIDVYDGIPYVTVQSATENFKYSGEPANAYGEISVSPSGRVEIEIFGRDRMTYKDDH
jgi:3',5'-cyclic AMP phosphodiesterase CpdA